MIKTKKSKDLICEEVQSSTTTWTTGIYQLTSSTLFTYQWLITSIARLIRSRSHRFVRPPERSHDEQRPPTASNGSNARAICPRRLAGVGRQVRLFTPRIPSPPIPHFSQFPVSLFFNDNDEATIEYTISTPCLSTTGPVTRGDRRRGG